jgi:hypothetical protein
MFERQASRKARSSADNFGVGAGEAWGAVVCAKAVKHGESRHSKLAIVITQRRFAIPTHLIRGFTDAPPRLSVEPGTVAPLPALPALGKMHRPTGTLHGPRRWAQKKLTQRQELIDHQI